VLFRSKAAGSADYVLAGTISQAELTVATVMNPAIGSPSQNYEAVMTVEFQMLSGPTRQVLFADQVHLSLEDALVRSLLPLSSTDSIDCNEAERQLVQRVASQIVDVVSERLFPIRIAAVKDDGMVILNQGGGRFAVGDTFEMFKVGPDMTDQATGKSLGRDEAGFGTIRIVKVLPRIAYARLVDGAIGNAAVGSVCRRVRAAAMPVMQTRPETVVVTPSGGVKLPGDGRAAPTVIRTK
jgi:hypothetical protein